MTAALRVHRFLKWLRVPQELRMRLMLWEWEWRFREATGPELMAFVKAARAALHR